MNKPNIVFLDAWTTHHGDQDWTSLERLGNFVAYDRTDPQLIGDRALYADILIVNKFPVNDDTLQCMPNLKYIMVAATGYNNIDKEAVERRQIPVSNVRNYSTEGVAQHVFSMLLAMSNRVEYYNREVKSGRWAASPDFCFYDHSISAYAGKTMGIVGYGTIGARVAAIAQAFGMRVLATTRDMSKEKPSYVHFVHQEELFALSDVISLHCALTPETQYLVRKETIEGMKDGVIIINTGRGPLVDSGAVCEGLHAGKVGWLGIDVMEKEPPGAEDPLWGHPGVLVTPHIAWAGQESRKNLIAGLAENLSGFLEGKIIHRVY